MCRAVFLTLVFVAHSQAFAGEAEVLNVEVSCDDDATCDFNVTVKHADDGWEHYANRWEVRTLDGKRLAVRELAHPHDNEQPFTRSLRNVHIPDDVNKGIVRARDSRHQYGGKEMTVELTKSGALPPNKSLEPPGHE